MPREGIFIPTEIDMKGGADQLRAFQKIAGEAGQKSAADLTKQFREEYRKQGNALKEALARGLDPGVFRALNRDLKRDFNEGVLASISQLRKQGKASDDELQKLQRTLKNIATTGGRSFQDANKESKGFLTSLRSVRTAVAGVIALLGIRKGIAFVRESIRDAVDLAKSYLQLQSAAKLFNVSQRDLADLSARARTEFALNASEANNLAVQVTKLAAKAGDATKSQSLLNAALDLGAAQGLDAATVALALEQALRGVDEGTDRLLQRNPSQIYKEFAAEIGKSVGQLTDAEQKQAIVNAVLREGAKVQGEYGRFLDSNVGKLTKWRQLLQSSSETIGSHAIPVITRLTTALAGPLSVAVTQISNLFDLFADPLDRVIARMERLGQASELALPLILQRRIEESRKSIADLERDFRGVGVSPRGGGLDEIGAEVSGSVVAAGEARARDPRDFVRLQRELATAQAELTRAIDAGSVKQIESAQIGLDAAQKRLAIARQIAAEEETARRSQAGLDEAERKAALAGQLAQVEAEIAETIQRAAVQGESAALDATLRVLEARKSDLEAQLGRAVTQAAPEELVNPEAAKKAATALQRLTELSRELRIEQEAAAKLGVSRFTIPADVAGKLQEIVRLEREIAEIRKLQKESGRPDAGAGLLAAREEELQLAQKSVADLTAKFNELFARSAPAIASVGQLGQSVANGILRAFEGVSVSLQEAVRAAGIAQSELTRASAAGDKDRTEAARRELAKRKQDIEEIGRTIARSLGDASPEAEEVRRIIDQIKTALGEASGNAAGFSAALIDGVETALRGILSAADAMGAFDDRTRRALTGVLDLVAGVGQLQKAQSSGTAATLSTLSGVGAIAGAAIGLGSALFSGNDAESEARKARDEELRRNTEALADLVRGLRSLGDELGPLTSAMQRAVDQAFGVVQRAVPDAGIGRPTTGQEAREALLLARSTAKKRGDLGAVEQLDAAIEAFDKFIERLRVQVHEDIDLREVALQGNQRLLDAARLRIEQEKELRDAEEAGLDEETLRRLRVLQGRERQAAEDALNEEIKRASEDRQLRQLEAQGLTQTAALRRFLIEQDRELADALKEGAEAAELAELATTQLAERQRFAADFVNNLLRESAVRRGDTSTVIALDQAQVAAQFADAANALEQLRDAGLITEDEFARLSQVLRDDLAPAMEAVAAAALEASQSFSERLAGDIEDLTDPEGAQRRNIERRAEELRKEARSLFGGESLAKELENIDRWAQLAIEALQSGASETAALPVGAGSTTQALTRSSETTALGIQDYTRQTVTELRFHTPLLRDIRDLLRANQRPVSINDFAAASPGGVSGGTRLTVNVASPIINISGGASAQQAAQTARAAAQAFSSTLATDTLTQIDRGLSGRTEQAKADLGIPTLPGFTRTRVNKSSLLS